MEHWEIDAICLNFPPKFKYLRVKKWTWFGYERNTETRSTDTINHKSIIILDTVYFKIRVNYQTPGYFWYIPWKFCPFCFYIFYNFSNHGPYMKWLVSNFALQWPRGMPVLLVWKILKIHFKEKRPHQFAAVFANFGMNWFFKVHS